LGQTSILADHFVQDHIRAVNERLVSAPLFVVGNEPKFNSRFGGAVSFLPEAVPASFLSGKEGDSNGSSVTSAKSSFPNRFMYPDIHFAVKQRTLEQERAAMKNKSSTANNKDASTLGNNDDQDTKSTEVSEETKTTAVTEEPKTIVEPQKIASLEVYLAHWEETLNIERKELLYRYEKFSQYTVMVHTPKDNQAHRAWITVPGIADATPPLQIGDVVLVRPLRLLSLPTVINGYISWSLPHHVVEIRTIVVAVNRRRAKRDSVEVSWLDNAHHAMLMQAMGITSPIISGPYNVRFVPSTKPQHRSLTALDWIGETFRSDGASFMNLMYPKEAPDVPLHTLSNLVTFETTLNERQTEFVNMVVSRTTRPSTKSIRGPMILTGPAGTGT
jgi:hypothetical protein